MKIISYSIFGEEQWYRKGLLKNIEIAKNLFSDWTVRVYISNKIEKVFIDDVLQFDRESTRRKQLSDFDIGILDPEGNRL